MWRTFPRVQVGACGVIISHSSCHIWLERLQVWGAFYQRELVSWYGHALYTHPVVVWVCVWVWMGL